MLDEYKFNFFEVNNIINKLPEQSKNKIPNSFKNFIEKNSVISSNEFDNNNIVTNNNFVQNAYSDETLKLLKIVDYYVNNDDYKL